MAIIYHKVDRPTVPSVPCAKDFAAIDEGFYLRDARRVACDLIGCALVLTRPRLLVAQIVETEAYLPDDPASHSYRGPTARTAAMFGPAGHAYVYFIYGNHHCFNVVTGRPGHGAAVLIRAAIPLVGTAEMARRRGVTRRLESSGVEVNGRELSGAGTQERSGDRGLRSAERPRLNLCNGPGKLAQAFGITRQSDNGTSLITGRIIVSRHIPGGGLLPNAINVIQDRRVGISRAAAEPWRYLAADCAYVSRKPGPAARPVDRRYRS